MLALINLLVNIVNIYFHMMVIYVIMGLLISFDVINRMNRVVSGIYQSLATLIEPALALIRQHITSRFNLGLDFSPIVLGLLLIFIMDLLLEFGGYVS